MYFAMGKEMTLILALGRIGPGSSRTPRWEKGVEYHNRKNDILGTDESIHSLVGFSAKFQRRDPTQPLFWLPPFRSD